MKKCLLCKENEPDKTGSHIVPHFLIKRIDNDDNKKGRDKELGFILGDTTTSTYFGRSVQPEKLNEVFGEVTDELISENMIDGIVDYYFCTDCEKKFSNIENIYAKSLERETKINENYTSLINPFLGFLFWISIIWRLSIQENSGFKLKFKEENKLGRILKNYLLINGEIILPEENDNDLVDIGYKLLRAPNYSLKNHTYLHWSPSYQRPYSIMIDEYILFLYFKKNHMKGIPLNFFESESLKSKALFNNPFSSEYIYGVAEENFKEICDEINMLFVRTRLKSLNSKLNTLHQMLGGNGKEMHPLLKEEIIQNIANSEAPIGYRHSVGNYVEIISETLMKYKNY